VDGALEAGLDRRGVGILGTEEEQVSKRQGLSRQTTITYLYDSMPVLERLEYPSSIFGKGISLDSTPCRDLMVEVELVRRAGSEGSLAMLVLLAILPYKLEPGVTDEPSHSASLREFPQRHAISGPLLPPASMSARCLGGGSGGGTGSLIFGMGTGTEGEDGDEKVQFSVDRLENRNRSDEIESGTWI
jgi:hypothetical protein